MSKRKLVVTSMGLLVALFIAGFILMSLLNNESSTPSDDTQEASPSTFYKERDEQTNELRQLFEQDSLVYSEENKVDLLFLLAKYEDEDQFENIIKLASSIPNTAEESDVVTKYRALLQATRLSKKFDLYTKFRTEYRDYIEEDPTRKIESLKIFDQKFLSAEELQKYEEVNLDDQT